jgi:hypothetical protein
MRSTEPPEVARWLLIHFGCSPNNSAVVGDLNERYGHGRPHLWYWKQAVQAIVMSFFQDVWSHKLLGIRALLVGWATKYVWLWLIGNASMVACIRLNVCRAIGDWHWYLHTPLLLASVMTSAAVCGLSAWAVSRTSGRHSRSMVLLYILVELLAVPIVINSRPGVASLDLPGQFAMLWSAPFATIVNISLSTLGYPFQSVFSLWFGNALMVMVMLWGSGAFRSDQPHSGRSTGSVIP